MKDFENSFKAINQGLKEKTLTQIKAKDLNEHALEVFKCYFRDESPESYQIYTYNDYTIFDIGIPKLKYLGTYHPTAQFFWWNPEVDDLVHPDEASMIVLMHTNPGVLNSYALKINDDGSTETCYECNGVPIITYDNRAQNLKERVIKVYVDGKYMQEYSDNLRSQLIEASNDPAEIRRQEELNDGK